MTLSATETEQLLAPFRGMDDRHAEERKARDDTIRYLLAHGVAPAVIMEAFGLSSSAVSKIRHAVDAPTPADA